MVAPRNGFWSQERWERIAPLSGVVAVVLLVVGFLVFGLAGDRPGDDAAADEYLSYFRDDAGAVWVGSWIAFIGFAAFIWFLGSLRTALLRAEGGVGRLASLAFAGGVAATILLLASLATQISGAIAADESENLSAQTAEALWWAGNGFFVAATFALAILLAATAIVALRSRVLPSWFAWLSGVMALVALVPFISWALVIFVMPLWIVGMSLWMWRGHEAHRAAETRTSVAPPP
jgi:hypothetical protein